MLIDWFTVGAQVINFLILVWLMKRYLYKPVLDAIDARERRVAAELADADARKAEAQKERDEFKQRNESLDKQRDELLAKAAEEAGVERKRLIEAARSAADALSAGRQKAMQMDAARLGLALRQRTSQEVFAIARKTLADLASSSLETSACAVFVRQLQSLDASTRSTLAAALAGATGPALVRSAFELPDAQRQTIEEALHQVFATDIAIRYEIGPDLIGGIELSANGQRLAWSIESYLASLQDAVTELLDKDSAAATATPTAPDPATPAAGSP